MHGFDENRGEPQSAARKGQCHPGVWNRLSGADRSRRKRAEHALLDLIETRGERGKWFAAAKDAGLLDIALICARDSLWLPGASHAGGTQSSNPLCSSRESCKLYFASPD